MKKLDNLCYHPKGCGVVALRQICDASVPDAVIMSAAINNGYDPIKGGMSPLTFRDSARQLGVKLTGFLQPVLPMTVSEAVGWSAREGLTLVIALEDHVLVADKGKVADPVYTPPWRSVNMLLVKY